MKILKKVKEIRSRNGELHFVRYALIEFDAFAIYIHRIYKEDNDKHLHDHPWNFIGIILNGTYVEAYEAFDGIGFRPRRPFVPVRVPASGYYHKIASLGKKPVTTLVLRGRRIHEWGYKTSEGFVEAAEYRKRKVLGNLPEN